MTETNTPSAGSVPIQQDKRDAQGPGTDQVSTQARTGSSLVTERGRTTIASEVVAKIAGMAAREVQGVHDFGTGPFRALGVIKGRLVGEDDITRGISVEVGERQAAVDVHIIVDYGVSIPDLAEAVRRNVINAIEHMCGLEVTEVNVHVDDVHLPREEAPAGAEGEPRVQ